MIKKAGISQLLLVCINLVSLGLIISGLGIGTAKEKANADVKSNIEWKQTACRVAVYHNTAHILPAGTVVNTDYEIYLGPAEWTANYTINSKNITEKWKSDNWKESVYTLENRSGIGPRLSPEFSTLASEKLTFKTSTNCESLPSNRQENIVGSLGNDGVAYNHARYTDIGLFSTGHYGVTVSLQDTQFEKFHITSSSIPQGWNVTMEY